MIEEVSDGTYDQLRLTNGISEVTLVGDPDSRGDPGTCLAEWAGIVGEGDGVVDAALLADEDGAPVLGAGRGYAYAALVLDYAAEDGATASWVVYLECRTVVPGEAVAVVVHAAPFAAYAAEAVARAPAPDAHLEADHEDRYGGGDDL